MDERGKKDELLINDKDESNNSNTQIHPSDAPDERSAFTKVTPHFNHSILQIELK